MKRIFIILLVTAALGVALSIAFSMVGVRSSDPSLDQVEQKKFVAFEPSPQVEPVESVSNVLEESIDPAETAEQVLADISNADVVQSTDRLNVAFNRLGEVCKKAVETRDIMLATRFSNKTDHAIDVPKGDDDGNE